VSKILTGVRVRMWEFASGKDLERTLLGFMLERNKSKGKKHPTFDEMMERLDKELHRKFPKENISKGTLQSWLQMLGYNKIGW